MAVNATPHYFYIWDYASSNTQMIRYNRNGGFPTHKHESKVAQKGKTWQSNERISEVLQMMLEWENKRAERETGFIKWKSKMVGKSLYK